jgi:Uma2 family endonuclease
MSTATPQNIVKSSGSKQITSEPAWDIARLFPNQGHWSEADYLELDTNRLVEFIDGFIEVLPMPTDQHQAIVAFLFEALLLFVRPAKLGIVRFAALKVKLRDGQFREPDVLFIKTENNARRQNPFWLWADLVMEVVSEDNRSHDLETKRFEYSRAGIPEYWIVDPMYKEITVLKLAGDHYDIAGVYRPGDRAASVLLNGFTVDVTSVFVAE